MNEYDYGEFEKKKDFKNEDQRTFWEAFSKGAKDGEERTFFTGNIQAISGFMSYEREKVITREKE